MRSEASLYAVYGSGGCGRGVLPVAARMLTQELGQNGYNLVFIDDEQAGMTVNGRQVMSFAEFASADVPARAVTVGIADPVVRRRVVERCTGEGVSFFSVVAPGTVVLDDVRVGEGAILSPFVSLTSNIRIGRHFQANLYAYVEHDCTIGDFVTFAPAVRCNGNVTIENDAYLGAGCVLRQGTPSQPLVIGRGATVGMGAVVTRSVPAGATVVGNPARPISRRST